MGGNYTCGDMLQFWSLDTPSRTAMFAGLVGHGIEANAVISYWQSHCCEIEAISAIDASRTALDFNEEEEETAETDGTVGKQCCVCNPDERLAGDAKFKPVVWFSNSGRCTICLPASFAPDQNGVTRYPNTMKKRVWPPKGAGRGARP